MIASKIVFPSSNDIKSATQFEIARGLTRTARDAMQAVKDDLPRKFILRRTWAIKGIRFDVATKEHLVATVYSVDPYMVKQEEGETRNASGRSLAIPVDARANERVPIPLGMFPKKMLGRKDVFKADLQGIGWGIFQRKKDGIKILYLLRPKKRTKPRWEFGETVASVVQKRFAMNFY